MPWELVSEDLECCFCDFHCESELEMEKHFEKNHMAKYIEEAAK